MRRPPGSGAAGRRSCGKGRSRSTLSRRRSQAPDLRGSAVESLRDGPANGETKDRANAWSSPRALMEVATGGRPFWLLASFPLIATAGNRPFGFDLYNHSEFQRRLLNTASF